MSSLRQDADGRQSLDWAVNGHHYTVVASTDGRWLTVSFDEGIVTVPVPSAAVAKKLAEMFAQVADKRRDAFAEDLLRQEAQCAHAYLDIGDRCSICNEVV